MPKGKRKKKVPPKMNYDEELKAPIPKSKFAVGQIHADMKIVEIKPEQERSIGFVYPKRGKYVTVPVGTKSTSPGGLSWNPDAMVTQPLIGKGNQTIGEAVAWDTKNVFWMSAGDFEAEAKVRATKYMIPTELVGK